MERGHLVAGRDQGTVWLPARAVSPLSSVVRRAAFALGLLVLTAVIVWVQGKG
jgi:hypothetical protein